MLKNLPTDFPGIWN